MTKYRDSLRAADPDLDEWVPQAVLDDAVLAVDSDVDLRAYIEDRSSHAEDVSPYSGYEIYTGLIAILVTAKAVWSTVTFADKAANLVLDDNAKLALAEKIVLRLRQAGMEHSAEKVQSWIDKILEEHTNPE